MASSEGARPKLQSKKVLDPDFVCDFPVAYFEHSAQSKTKLPSKTSIPDQPSTSLLTFDQEIELIKLQKEKLQLELQVLQLHERERPLNIATSDEVPTDVVKDTAKRRVKHTSDWPQNFVPIIQGEYDKLEFSDFVSDFLIITKLIKGRISCTSLAMND